MRCQRVRNELALMALQGLDSAELQRVKRHLADCDACRVALREHEFLAGLLAHYVPPRLPGDFSARLHARLVTQGNHQDSDELCDQGQGNAGLRWKMAAMFVLGALLGALGAYAVSGRGDRRSGDGTGLSRTLIQQREILSLGGDEVPDRKSGVALKKGQDAVVELEFFWTGPETDVELQLVLPEGLALLGPGRVVFPEKRLTVRRRLVPGMNRVLLAVQATRVGMWVLAATARVHGESSRRSEARIRVLEAHGRSS